MSQFVSRVSAKQLWLALLLAFCRAARVNAEPAREFPPDSATLQSFAGRYEASPDTIITVRRHSTGLALEVSAGSPMEFRPESTNRFVHEPSGTRISFVRGEQGKVTELVLERGGEHRARRISDIPSTERVQTVNVSANTFQTVINGDGKAAVVLVSGLGNWAKVSAGINRMASIVRYQADGVPTANRVPLDADTQARLLHELLKKLQVTKPCILVGHSFDGALVRIFADLYPKDISGLVLVDPFDEGFVDWLKLNQPKNYELFRQRAIENYVEDWDDFLKRLRRAHLPKGIPVVLLTAGHREIRQNDVLESNLKPADLEAGATAVRKAHDAWIAKVPNSRLVVVPNAGHEIPREQPAYVIEAINQILSDIKQAQ